MTTEPRVLWEDTGLRLVEIDGKARLQISRLTKYEPPTYEWWGPDKDLLGVHAFAILEVANERDEARRELAECRARTIAECRAAIVACADPLGADRAGFPMLGPAGIYRRCADAVAALAQAEKPATEET